MILTADEIRAQLKQWDRVFGYKPSKTLALLDPKYFEMPRDRFDRYLANACRVVLSRVSYRENISDCENFSNWVLGELQQRWAEKSGENLEPAVFRIVISGTPIHSILMAFLQEGIHFIEPQTGETWHINEYNPKILAVT